MDFLILAGAKALLTLPLAGTWFDEGRAAAPLHHPPAALCAGDCPAGADCPHDRLSQSMSGETDLLWVIVALFALLVGIWTKNMLATIVSGHGAVVAAAGFRFLRLITLPATEQSKTVGEDVKRTLQYNITFTQLI